MKVLLIIVWLIMLLFGSFTFGTALFNDAPLFSKKLPFGLIPYGGIVVSVLILFGYLILLLF